MAMAAMAAIGIVLALFLHDRVLEDLRRKEAGADRDGLQREPAD